MSTKCAAFWHHTNLRSDNKIFPCCRYKESIMTFEGNISEVLTSKVYEDLRNRVSNGEYLSGCQKCYQEEACGKKSLRKKFNEEYDTDNISLKYFEVGFDNVCNLTCDGCWDEFSHSWAKKNNPAVPVKFLIKNTSEIRNIPESIEKVLFLGGEPLMTNQHKTFLKRISDLGKLEVIYNTNGTFLLDEETINLLKKAKKVRFIVSIDGYGNLQEKVRTGSKWQDILDFLSQLTELGFNFSIHSVIHLNNWHGFGELSNFIKRNNYQWSINVLTYPERLYISNSKNKDEIIKYIEGISIPDKDYILKFLKNENIK